MPARQRSNLALGCGPLLHRRVGWSAVADSILGRNCHAYLTQSGDLHDIVSNYEIVPVESAPANSPQHFVVGRQNKYRLCAYSE